MVIIKFIIELYNTFKGFLKWIGKQIQKLIGAKLIRENEELKVALSKKPNMQFDENEMVYYVIKDDGRKDGPFCPKCWEGLEKQMHLHPWGDCRKCLQCNSLIYPRNYHFNSSNDDDLYGPFN